MRIFLFSLIVTGLSPLSALAQLEGDWTFADEPRIEERDWKWSEISVVRRPVPIAETYRESLKVEGAGLLPQRLDVVREHTPLLDAPEALADLRDGKPADSVVDAFDFWDAMTFGLGGGELAELKRGEKLRWMFCTVYYTPLEEGFTADRGFDMTPETKPGLGGRKFPRDFLAAVYIEGFGKMKEPYKGKPYIKFDGRWGYDTRILGNRNNTLKDRRSVAVHRRNKAFGKGDTITILDKTVFDAMGALEWEVADTGGGLKDWQLDLYWGEDWPMGPGMDRYRPMFCPLAVKFWFPVVITPK